LITQPLSDGREKREAAQLLEYGHTVVLARRRRHHFATDTVKVHYHGTFINGKVFDSSVQRNQPATFRLNAVIACWTEGVQKIKVGGKAKLVCPSDVAYGDRGRPPSIPPGTTLVFEVELLEILPAK